MAAMTLKRGAEASRIGVSSPQSLPELIYEALRDGIVCGSLKPGQPLRQEELASQFKASRVPLREALQQLQAEGLVVLRPRRGYAVATLDGQQIFEILQLRILIEGHGGYVATLGRGPADIKALEACLRDLDRMPTTGLNAAQISRWSILNQRFHDTLIAAGRRPHLQQIAGNLRSKIESYIRMEISFIECLDEAQLDHHEILQAFRNGDAERVAIVSRLHAEATAHRFVQALIERGLVTGVPNNRVTDLGPAAMLVQPRPQRQPERTQPAAAAIVATKTTQRRRVTS